MKTGIELIQQERNEQIHKHNRQVSDDVRQNDSGQLIEGALMVLGIEYTEGINDDSFPDGWNVDICFKMCKKPLKERLVIAAALLAAEIDRLQALEKTK